MLASATPEHYRQAERILLADDAIDSLLVIFIPPIASNADDGRRGDRRGRRPAHASPCSPTFMSARGAPPELCRRSRRYPFPESAVDRARRAPPPTANGGGGPTRDRPDASGHRRRAARPRDRRAGARTRRRLARRPTETERAPGRVRDPRGADARRAHAGGRGRRGARSLGFPVGAQGGRTDDPPQDRGRGRPPRASATTTRSPGECRDLKKRLGARPDGLPRPDDGARRRRGDRRSDPRSDLRAAASSTGAAARSSSSWRTSRFACRP